MTSYQPQRPAVTGFSGGGIFNALRGGNSRSLLGGAGFNSLGAGDKVYGLGGTSTPNRGPVSNHAGYAERDTRLAAQRAALANIAGRLR
jgi:hypothetical protein